MNRKLSEIVRDIPTKYDYIHGTLYEKGTGGKKCAVCAIGGIALACDEEYYMPRLQDELIKQDLSYNDILEHAGVPKEVINYRPGYVWTFTDSSGVERTLRMEHLATMIFTINDRTGGFDEVVKFLEHYGL